MENRKTIKEVFSLWVERISLVEGLFKAFLGMVIGGGIWMIMTAGHVQSPHNIYALSIYLFFLAVIGVAMILIGAKVRIFRWTIILSKKFCLFFLFI